MADVGEDQETAIAVELRRLLPRLYRRVRYYGGDELTPSELSALCRLEDDGPLRTGRLAELEDVTPATISRLITRLEGQSLVSRRRDPADARATQVAITTAGQRLIDDQRARRTAVLVAELRRLPAEDRRALAEALPVLDRLADSPAAPSGTVVLRDLVD
ncbi:MarR family winged helix-turn-helix transcriptional regulator [Euzebya sp.]|uniref:MarR family winged helix-turn-helix transcriptional regulator n=1 Tax=Euzebya sp. TaxID=1971409 RepID=UPI003513556F